MVNVPWQKKTEKSAKFRIWIKVSNGSTYILGNIQILKKIQPRIAKGSQWTKTS